MLDAVRELTAAPGGGGGLPVADCTVPRPATAIAVNPATATTARTLHALPFNVALLRSPVLSARVRIYRTAYRNLNEVRLTGARSPCARTSCSSVGAEAARAFSAPTREQALQLGRVGAQLLGSARWIGSSSATTASPTSALNCAVAAAVVARLDRRDRLAGRDAT